MTDWRIENCVTLVCTTALILGLYALSHDMNSFWGLLLLINLNSETKVKSSAKKQAAKITEEQQNSSNSR